MKPASPHLALRHPLNRRTFLRGAGAAVALPFLDAMRTSSWAENASPMESRRVLFINLHLGFLARHFIPQETGSAYSLPRYLQVIEDYQDSFTVITGTSH
ncbi:MAG: twin-arginine translocation signal domain-containing protein, partial [Verrucomicrobiota bacterium]